MHTPLRAFVRYVQSNVAYWNGRYDEAAQLVEAALPDATSGTAVLRLVSQQARHHDPLHPPRRRADVSIVGRRCAVFVSASLRLGGF